MKKRLFGVIIGAALTVAVFGVPPFTGGPDADYLDVENAAEFKTEVRRHPNGVFEVSAFTQMPGLTPEMVRWWFADYMQTTAHYQRWHPAAHVWMNWENKVPGEYVGASHLVHEYIDLDLDRLRIQFVPPETILGDVQFRADDVAVCAFPGLLEQPLNVGKMCHIIRTTDDGAQMLSRFWLGYVAKRDGNETVPSIEGLIGNTYLARRVGVRKSYAVALMNHATQEMGNLAEFLPTLYAAKYSKSESEVAVAATDGSNESQIR
jgi:hypothetical protein